MPSKYKAKARDDYGSRKGTIAARVNRAVSVRWQTAEEIAKNAGVPEKSARRRLYHGVEKGIYDHEKIIRFKFKRRAK